MKVLIVGVGGVGESIAAILDKRDSQGEWLEQMVLADYNLDRAQKVSTRRSNPTHFPAERIDAGSAESVAAVIKQYSPDILVNCCDPSFNKVLFDSCYEQGINYMDCAMTLSTAHPTDPCRKTHVKLGDYQFEQHEKWKEKGLLAVVGSGVEPGMADIFARYAEKYFFDELEEIGIRDGNNFEIEGVDIAFGFSIWTTIEECLNPPVIWEREKGWFTTEPFSEPEVFTLPEGIGAVEMVNVEHEEVLLIPRYIDKGLKRVTFKFGLGDEFINCLKYLRALNLDRVDVKVKVGDSEITPRDFVAKCAPNPIEIGRKMVGKTCAGTWVKGKKNGLEREIYMYQVADNQQCIEIYDCQAVVAQTAFTPAITLELLAKKIWTGSGVQGSEYFEPEPYIELMATYDFPSGLMEMDSEYKRKQDTDKMVAIN
jgi:saccharopine dehydrogenase-like NADP-dependent oxidoreductase